MIEVLFFAVDNGGHANAGIFSHCTIYYDLKIDNNKNFAL